MREQCPLHGLATLLRATLLVLLGHTCSPRVAPTSHALRHTLRRTFKDPFVALIFAVIVLFLTTSRSLLVSLPEQPLQRSRLFDFELLRSAPPRRD